MAAPKLQRASSLVGALPLLTVLAAVGLVAAVYFLLYVPKIAPLLPGGRLDPSLQRTKNDNDDAYLLRAKKAITEYVALNPEKKRKGISLVTKDPDVPGIYVQLDTIARSHEFIVSSVDVTVSDKGNTVPGTTQVRISANLTGGTYAQFKLLLSDLERSSRLFDVQSVVFAPSTGIYGIVIRAYEIDDKTIFSAPKAANAGEAAAAETP